MSALSARARATAEHNRSMVMPEDVEPADDLLDELASEIERLQKFHDDIVAIGGDGFYAAAVKLRSDNERLQRLVETQQAILEQFESLAKQQPFKDGLFKAVSAVCDAREENDRLRKEIGSTSVKWESE